jgi:hypothetical protein
MPEVANEQIYIQTGPLLYDQFFSYMGILDFGGSYKPSGKRQRHFYGADAAWTDDSGGDCGDHGPHFREQGIEIRSEAETGGILPDQAA